MRDIRIEHGITAAELPFDALIEAGEPVLLRGVVSDWPLVAAAAESPEAAMRYLSRFDAGHPVTAYAGDPAIKGRFFYNADLTGLNFETARVPLSAVFERLRSELAAADPAAIYVGSTDLDAFFPGLRDENDLVAGHALFDTYPPLASIWLGNRTTASAHYDMSNNAACCVAGGRRFTLFPPDQIANLYPGPLEPTPGGQVVSLVDIADPDLERFPRYAEASEHAVVAEMEPGDVLVYPALWWHHVEALAPFNILVNYWWNTAPAHMDTPMNTLLYGLLTLRNRSAYERRAWRDLFDYYVFGPPEQAADHLPEHARGPLGTMDSQQARRLRARLMQRLNR